MKVCKGVAEPLLTLRIRPFRVWEHSALASRIEVLTTMMTSN